MARVLRISGIGLLLGLLAIAIAGAVILLPSALIGLSNESADLSKMTPADQAKTINDVRVIFLQVLAGVGVAITIYFSGRTLQLSRRGQVSDRFTKAIDQLGGMQPDVRLGAIYALEQIARDSRELHVQIMDILATYLRSHSQGLTPLTVTQEEYASARSYTEMPEPKAAPILSADLQAAATVLGRRTLAFDPIGIRYDLSHTVLSGVNFFGAELDGFFFEDAHLEKAIFNWAKLSGASFLAAHLERARFDNAVLREASFFKAHLEGATFWAADLQAATFASAHLLNVRFFKADVNGTKFSSIVESQRQGPNKWDAMDLTDDSLFGALHKERAFLPHYIARSSDSSPP